MQSDGLANNLKLHTGEKSSNCKISLKLFVPSGYLTTHKRIHTGEKCFNLKICTKQFAYSSRLRYRLRVHDETQLLLG